MVFAKTWEDFEIAAEAMLMESPEKCRYSMKYAHSKQHLILKVTNNLKVSSHVDLLLMSLMMIFWNYFYFRAFNTKPKSCLIWRRSRSSREMSWISLRIRINRVAREINFFYHWKRKSVVDQGSSIGAVMLSDLTSGWGVFRYLRKL